MSLINSVSISALTLLVTACAVGSEPSALSIQKSDNALVLAGASMGQSYDEVMQTASSRFAVEPHCEQRKIAYGLRRKAHPYEVCAFEPDTETVADAPLSEVVYHFIDTKLVRVDMRASGGDQLIEKMKGDASVAFGATASENTASKQRLLWQGDDAVFGVRQGTSASSGSVYIRLNHADLAINVPWLAED